MQNSDDLDVRAIDSIEQHILADGQRANTDTKLASGAPALRHLEQPPRTTAYQLYRPPGGERIELAEINVDGFEIIRGCRQISNAPHFSDAWREPV